MNGGTQKKNMEDAIYSLASSIKKNMVAPAEQRLDELEGRLSGAERTILFLTRAFILAGATLAAAMAAVIYHIIK
ncbi:MAG: hypothetical protein ACOY31_07175 [Bacillota bacterium]